MILGRSIGLLVLALSISGCSSPPPDEDVGLSGAFLSDSEDEILDPNDPPTNPDPAGDEATAVTPQANGSNGAACRARGADLSPQGLTFVIHVSDRGKLANDAIAHLKKIRRYIRARDIFMVERSNALNAELHALFPCNKIHFIAYPDELGAALASGDLIDGIAIDWEGDTVDRSSQAYSIDKLEGYAARIRKQGRQAAFVPSWQPRFEDAKVKRAAHMSYELAQIQPACTNTPRAFAHRASEILHEYRRENVSLRDVGFEISLDSFGAAQNHVGPARAADCTRAAYGKGARAIYIYGNGPDNLVDYFHGLGKLGVRIAR
jgi:hypothetical protein